MSLECRLVYVQKKGVVYWGELNNLATTQSNKDSIKKIIQSNVNQKHAKNKEDVIAFIHIVLIFVLFGAFIGLNILKFGFGFIPFACLVVVVISFGVCQNKIRKKKLFLIRKTINEVSKATNGAVQIVDNLKLERSVRK